MNRLPFLLCPDLWSYVPLGLCRIEIGVSSGGATGKRCGWGVLKHRVYGQCVLKQELIAHQPMRTVVTVVNYTLHAAPKAQTHRAWDNVPGTRNEKHPHPEGVPHLLRKAVRHRAGRRFRIDTGNRPVLCEHTWRAAVPGRRDTEADDADAADSSGQMRR